MSFQAYIDNIYDKTGKTPDDFLKDAFDILQCTSDILKAISSKTES